MFPCQESKLGISCRGWYLANTYGRIDHCQKSAIKQMTGEKLNKIFAQAVLSLLFNSFA